MHITYERLIRIDRDPGPHTPHTRCYAHSTRTTRRDRDGLELRVQVCAFNLQVEMDVASPQSPVRVNYNHGLVVI